MKQYLDILNRVMTEGDWKRPSRPGLPYTKEIFGVTERFDLSGGKLPLLTTKKVSFKNILTELLWFLKGDINIKYLVDNGCNIWNDDSYRYYKELGGKLSKEDWLQKLGEPISDEPLSNPVYIQHCYGDCGMLYGLNWRNFNEDGFDQLNNLVKSLRNKPSSRYQIVTGWNPNTIGYPISAALPACHMLFQCNVREDSHLDLMFLQRSCDLFLGVPYNWASYGILLHILAALTGYEPGELIWVGNSVHIYENQFNAVEEQLKRTPGELPTLSIDMTKINRYVEEDSLDELWVSLEHSDFSLINYNPQGAIKAPLSTGTVRR